MSWVDSLRVAEETLESSYDEMEAAIEAENNSNPQVREYLEEERQKIAEELDQYESKLEDAHRMLNDLGHEDNSEALEAVENAGQHLVNAYAEAKSFYSTSIDVMYEGEKAINGPVLVTFDSGNSGGQIMNNAVKIKEDAFEQYDELLEHTTAKIVDKYSEESMIWHVDVGLKHQEPE